jgi:hypothetical protein
MDLTSPLPSDVNKLPPQHPHTESQAGSILPMGTQPRSHSQSPQAHSRSPERLPSTAGSSMLNQTRLTSSHDYPAFTGLHHAPATLVLLGQLQMATTLAQNQRSAGLSTDASQNAQARSSALSHHQPSLVDHVAAIQSYQGSVLPPIVRPAFSLMDAYLLGQMSNFQYGSSSLIRHQPDSRYTSVPAIHRAQWQGTLAQNQNTAGLTYRTAREPLPASSFHQRQPPFPEPPDSQLTHAVAEAHLLQQLFTRNNLFSFPVAPPPRFHPPPPQGDQHSHAIQRRIQESFQEKKINSDRQDKASDQNNQSWLGDVANGANAASASASSHAPDDANSCLDANGGMNSKIGSPASTVSTLLDPINVNIESNQLKDKRWMMRYEEMIAFQKVRQKHLSATETISLINNC